MEKLFAGPCSEYLCFISFNSQKTLYNGHYYYLPYVDEETQPWLGGTGQVLANDMV